MELERPEYKLLKKAGKAAEGGKELETEEILTALRRRMQIQLEYPSNDAMWARVIPFVDKFREYMTGKILDAGCYTGALYHYLGKPKGYVGIDVWGYAIKVAREFAPEADFRHQNLMDIDETFDVVWSSQISLGPREIKKLKTLATRVILIVPKDGATLEVHPTV
jgi:SAM-dependent methyltransferase